MWRRCLFTAVVFLLGISLAQSAWAQGTNATISGRVEDQSGAAIPKAKIVAINVGTNLKYSTETNGLGFYAVNVPPVALIPQPHWHECLRVGDNPVNNARDFPLISLLPLNEVCFHDDIIIQRKRRWRHHNFAASFQMRQCINLIPLQEMALARCIIGKEAKTAVAAVVDQPT